MFSEVPLISPLFIFPIELLNIVFLKFDLLLLVCLLLAEPMLLVLLVFLEDHLSSRSLLNLLVLLVFLLLLDGVLHSPHLVDLLLSLVLKLGLLPFFGLPQLSVTLVLGSYDFEMELVSLLLILLDFFLGVLENHFVHVLLTLFQFELVLFPVNDLLLKRTFDLAPFVDDQLFFFLYFFLMLEGLVLWNFGPAIALNLLGKNYKVNIGVSTATGTKLLAHDCVVDIR